MIFILSLVLFQEFFTGKNAEPSDIANSCSYEPTADEKKFQFPKVHIETSWKCISFVLSLTSECFCIV